MFLSENQAKSLQESGLTQGEALLKKTALFPLFLLFWAFRIDTMLALFYYERLGL
jgi:hypothetical protein